MRTLLFGANGQLGHRLAALLPGCTALTRAQGDFSMVDRDNLEVLIDEAAPDIIINAAAYTAVDLAESKADEAQRVNAEVPGWLAGFAAKRDVPFVHFSTDYVFDGEHGAPYREEAPTNPLNRYGMSKLAGERAVLAAHPAAVIFRLQWVFDARGRNFLHTAMRLLKEKDYFTIVADQRGAPSAAPFLARALVQALPLIGDGAMAGGIYHLASAGNTSWHGFACAIRDALGMRGKVIEPIVSEEYPVPARRPRDGRMDTSKLAAFGIALPHWREQLAAVMEELDADR